MGQPVVTWQILAKSPDALADFYHRLFSWEVDANNALGYRTINTKSEKGIGGGIWPAPPEGRPMVQLFIEVDDVSAYVEKAKQLGASIIIPAQKLPDGDEMAILLDVEGIPFGLVKHA